MSLLMSEGSSVAWMILAPAGILTPKLVSVNEQPMPRIKSDLSRKVRTVCGMARPPEPSDRACVSGNALLPPRLVVTGMASSSASSLSSPQASAQCTPVPA